MIDCVIYSYKNKNLLEVVETLLKNTKSKLKVSVFDQHPIDREESFKKIGDSSKLLYTHIFWDTIDSPCEKKADVLNSSRSEYFLIMSDDVLVKDGWDIEAIEIIQNNNNIISGNGEIKLTQKDKFSFKKDVSYSEDYLVSNVIDRNFIFAKTKTLQSCTYPFNLKYVGEEELYSLRLYKAKNKIYSAPSNFYLDLKLKTLESLYTPFSKEHGNHKFIRELKNAPKDFLEFHGIKSDNLYFLPYATDDVEYNPARLDFQDLDARKFIEDIKTIS